MTTRHEDPEQPDLLDVRIAREIYGLNVVHEDWPCSIDYETGLLIPFMNPTMDDPDLPYHEPIYLPEATEDEDRVWPPQKLEMESWRQEVLGDMWYHGAEVLPRYAEEYETALALLEEMHERGWGWEIQAPANTGLFSVVLHRTYNKESATFASLSVSRPGEDLLKTIAQAVLEADHLDRLNTAK